MNPFPLKTKNRGNLRPRALGHVCPVAALEQGRVKPPELFVSEINNLPGLDSYL